MFGLILCWFFGVHDWKRYQRENESDKSTILFLCPRCNAHRFFNISWRQVNKDMCNEGKGETMKVEDISDHVWMFDGIIHYDSRIKQIFGTDLRLFFFCVEDNIIGDEWGEKIDYAQVVEDYDNANKRARIAVLDKTKEKP